MIKVLKHYRIKTIKLHAHLVTMKKKLEQFDNDLWKTVGGIYTQGIFYSILSHNLGRSSGHHR